MKNNQNKRYSDQIKFLIFTLLLLTVSACLNSRSGKNSGGESPSRNDVVSDIKKVKTKSASKPAAQNAAADNENEITDENTDGNVDEKVNEADNDLIKKVCRKYDSCGSQDYETCMAESENINYSDEVYECMLKSSCKSLQAGKPDACTGAENNPEVYEQKQAPCPQIKCSKNTDCPGTCYGGCKNGICLLF